mgnify:CR=1 FL=1
MSDYRRYRVPGCTWFFTVVTAHRRTWLRHAWARATLGGVMREVRTESPFETVAIVILPDHLHAIWRLPGDDDDFAGRWRRIKQRTTLRLRRDFDLRGRLWQPRFWEHRIRDQADLHRHIEYIHYNPVKHGLVAAASEWQASTFHRYVAEGVHSLDWAGPAETIRVGE